MSQAAMSRQSWGLLLLLSAIWGGSFLFIEIALLSMGPMSLVFFRVLIGALSLGIYAKVIGLVVPRTLSFWRAVFVMGALNNAIPFVLIAYGQITITGGMASIINANTAFFGVLLAALCLANEGLKWHRLFGVMIGISGVVVVIGSSELRSLNVASMGQLAVLLATLSYAVASVWGKLRLQGYAGPVTALCTTWCATLIMFPVMLLTEGVPQFALTPQIWLVAIGLGVIGTGGAYLLYFKILALAGASNLMLVTIIVPVFAVSLDALVLGQWVAAVDLLGFAIIALGLMVMDGRLFRLS